MCQWETEHLGGLRVDKSQVWNYRTAIFELLIFLRLKHNLMSNNILINEEFGFHDNVSTSSAIFKLIETIFNAWNNKEYVMGLFCDLTKAFDSVSHELLILKLEFHGVKGCILNWLKSFLHNRVVLQFVSSRNLLSEWK